MPTAEIQSHEPDRPRAESLPISPREEGAVATTETQYLQRELERRREVLHSAIHGSARDAGLAELLRQVDSALERVQEGTFGICESCHESIEADRLLADPLIRFCVDHLNSEERRALESDLELAARIQRGLLPPAAVRVAGWEARYYSKPAGVVSGDYCDLIETDGVLNFLLGDVTGKGVAASMLMSHLHATFRTLASQGLSPERMTEAANRIFCESTLAGQYATLVVGRAAASGEVELVSAGHWPVLHLRDGSVGRIEATGVPLGMFCNSRFSTHRVDLNRGERLVLYTDGISEASNAAGEEFGLDRLARVAEECRALPLEAVTPAFLQSMQRFVSGAAPKDDVTLLVIGRAG